MSQNYQDAQRELQDRFDTRRLADRLAEATSDVIGDAFKAFIEKRDMFFLSTADADGWPQCSYKGGDPGFVRVIDERTLVFPVYNGNGMFLSTGNLADNPKVGMLFIDWETGTRLRLNGTASIEADGPLVEEFPGALFAVRVTPHAVFANCRRYVHRMQRLERSPFVPSPKGDAPVPDWKRDSWFEGTLPGDDPALDPEKPAAPSIPIF